VNESVVGDRYQVEARIGAGGMAEVYRGTDPVLGRTVAIKVLLPQFARDASFVARFRREAMAAARLNHPNIVGVFDTGADGDTQYIVMEFIEGRTLADVLASGRRPSTTQSIELAQRIAGALSAAHEQGIVHRDIKPANVMVTREGQVKVMDFGIARIQTVETAPQTSSVLGTPTYLSPEQAQGLSVDERSDLYSLGVVLYELLAGRPPFTGDSPVAIAYKQVNETPPPPSSLNPEVAPALDAVVMKALAKNPANRYQTAEEFTADLERVKQGEDVLATPLLVATGDATQVIARPAATQVLPPPTEPERGGRSAWFWVLITLLVLAILGGGGYLLAQAFGDDTVMVPMPKVVGTTYADAKTELEGLNLVVQDPPEKILTDEEQPNTVLKQSEKPGTQVAEGTTIVLTIAKAPATVKVPDLIGHTLSDATALLAQQGLTLGNRTTTTSDTYDDGVIVDQAVPAGQEVDPNTIGPIDVVVVDNPDTVTVDDYTCMTFGSAQAKLHQIGLVAQFAGVRPLLAECPNPNYVTFQDPGPGEEVQAGSTVLLYTGQETSSSSSTPTSPPSSGT
jgi:eukaryotic-like serine/threonine-protein kinase